MQDPSVKVFSIGLYPPFGSRFPLTSATEVYTSLLADGKGSAFFYPQPSSLEGSPDEESVHSSE